MLVFMALLEAVLTSTLARYENDALALRIDRWSRRLFPAGFVVIIVFTFVF